LYYSPHTHLDLNGLVPSIGPYLQYGVDEQTLVIDLKESSVTTVSFEPVGSPRKTIGTEP
jgi:hypothetical protein